MLQATGMAQPPVEDADDDGGGLVALESRIDGHCQPAGHPPGEHPPEQRCEAEGYVQFGLAGTGPVAAVVEPLPEILAQVVHLPQGERAEATAFWQALPARMAPQTHRACPVLDTGTKPANCGWER